MILTSCDILRSYAPYDGKNHQWPQAFAVVTSAVGTLNAAALASWTSPSIPILTSNQSPIGPITFEEASYLTVIPPIATMLSAPIWSYIVDGLGRKTAITMMAIIYFISWMLIAFGYNLSLIYTSRCLEGIGDAALFTAVPIYIGETTEPLVRSSWGNAFPFFGFCSQFLINTIGSYFTISTTAIIFSFIPLIQFFLLFLIPESPYYFLMKNKEKEARDSLTKLRWNENVDDELLSISKTVQQQISEPSTFKDLFTEVVNRKALLIAIGLRAIQQFSGISAFYMYTQYMFDKAGGTFSASTSSIIFTAVFFIVITLFSFIIHRFGRKILMISSCLSCGIVLTVESIFLFISEETDVDVSSVSWIPIAGMLLYVPACAFGLAMIPTLMLGELFSASVKGKAMCILNVFFALFILTSVKLFQVLSYNVGLYLPFGVFSLACYIGTVFSYYLVPETRGKTLDEIQQYFKSGNNANRKK